MENFLSSGLMGFWFFLCLIDSFLIVEVIVYLFSYRIYEVVGFFIYGLGIWYFLVGIRSLRIFFIL